MDLLELIRLLGWVLYITGSPATNCADVPIGQLRPAGPDVSRSGSPSGRTSQPDATFGVLVHLERGEIVFEVENSGSRPATVVDARLVSVRPGARMEARLDWDERQSYVPPYDRRLVRLKLEEQNIRGL